MRALFRFDVDQMLDTLFINLNTSLPTHMSYSLQTSEENG